MAMHTRALSLTLLLAATLGAQSTLTTTFTSDNGGAVGGAVHFDITVLNPAGVVLSQIDTNCGNPASTPARIEVYTTAVGGTYIGNQVNPPPGTWFRRAHADVTTAGQNGTTVGILNKPVALPPGTYGVTLVHRGCSARYTGTGSNPPTQTVFATNDIRLDLGSAQNTPFSSGTFSPRVANVTLHYDLPIGDTPDFTADVTEGASTLLVNFQDRSLTAGTITSHAWDFNDDGTVDSTVANPAWGFPLCGDYSVRLTITTATGSRSVVWNDMISVDPLRADFQPSVEVGPPPLTVQFTDSSSLQAITWAWDFDGDGVVDSQQQNPSFTFDAGCHEVSLTVTNGCRTDTVKKRITAAADSLTTGFNANSFVNRTSVIYFDLQVTATEALSVCGIDFTSFTPAGNAMNVDVYLTDDTAVGKETSPTEWRRVASAVGTTPGANTPARLVLDRPILLLPGRTYGVGLHHFGNASHYVNLSAPISNPELTLTPIGVSYVPNGPFTAGLTFAPRQWVGTIHYLKQTQWPQAGITFFGQGCAGSLGIPTLAPVGQQRPLLGTSYAVEVGGLAANAGFMLLGFSNTVSPVGPLPVDLSPVGMTGCRLRVSNDAAAPLAGVNGSATFQLTVPVTPALAGLVLFQQAVAVDPGANQLGATVSDAVGVMLGIY